MSLPNNVRVFWVEIRNDIGTQNCTIESIEKGTCTRDGGLGRHVGHVEFPEEITKEQWDNDQRDALFLRALETKPKCLCGFEFTRENSRSLGRGFSPAFVNPATGEKFKWNDLPVGAMYTTEYHHDIPEWCGPDGLSLHVKLPDGHTWHVDGRANNCTMKDDKVHKCWVRHGDPRKGECHVDKSGNTCAAGAGSILTSKWHGFLHNNHLVSC